MRVLVLQSNPRIAQDAECILRNEGFHPYTISEGEEGLDLIRRYEYELVLLDLQLPDRSGCGMIQAIRRCKSMMPIIVLTTVADTTSHIAALEAGADDLVTVPFNGRELVARIRAVMRRSRGRAQPPILIGALTIETSSRMVFVSDKLMKISSTEYRILEILSLRKGTVVSRASILDHIHGPEDERSEQLIDAYISRLRKKITDANGGRCISTIRGLGYMMGKPV